MRARLVWTPRAGNSRSSTLAEVGAADQRTRPARRGQGAALRRHIGTGSTGRGDRRSADSLPATAHGGGVASARSATGGDGRSADASVPTDAAEATDAGTVKSAPYRSHLPVCRTYSVCSNVTRS